MSSLSRKKGLTGYHDVVARQMPNLWVIKVMKTFYPMVRDLSPFRGLLVYGQIFGQVIEAYKQSSADQVDQECQMVHELLQTVEFSGWSPSPCTSEP